MFSRNTLSWQCWAQLPDLMRTRMHSSRMRTARCSGHLQPCMSPCHTHTPVMHAPCHTHPPPVMHAPCHTCPPAMHASLPCIPLPCTPPAMHTPHHAHTPPCTHPIATHTSLPCMPPAMHAPHHAHPLPCTPPCRACPLSCIPPTTHPCCHPCPLPCMPPLPCTPPRPPVNRKTLPCLAGGNKYETVKSIMSFKQIFIYQCFELKLSWLISLSN